jgi:uncharacterized repeat protein (TIGR04052 family)
VHHSLIAFLLAVPLYACTPERATVPVRFIATWGGQPFACATPAGAVELSDLRFFVSELEFLASDGSRTPATLADNGRWQGDTVALVDLENAEESCRNGTPDTNDAVLTSVPAGDYRGLRFKIGVPFATNHSDPLEASAPLDDTTMHWHWRSGYKFLRVGTRGPEGRFLLHLGSAGCDGTITDIRGCRYPNRVTVELDQWQPGMRIAVDLQVLARAAGASRGDAHCESGPADPVCRALMPALGLGDTAGGPQQLFRVQAP